MSGLRVQLAAGGGGIVISDEADAVFVAEEEIIGTVVAALSLLNVLTAPIVVLGEPSCDRRCCSRVIA